MRRAPRVYLPPRSVLASRKTCHTHNQRPRANLPVRGSRAPPAEDASEGQSVSVSLREAAGQHRSDQAWETPSTLRACSRASVTAWGSVSPSTSSSVKFTTIGASGALRGVGVQAIPGRLAGNGRDAGAVVVAQQRAEVGAAYAD